MNIVMTGKGEFVEIQGTAEKNPFSREQTDQLLNLATDGIGQLIRLQNHMVLERLNEVSLGNS